MDFSNFNITQYYMVNITILHVILSITHFNILLHIGEYWFQYHPILPEHDAASCRCHDHVMTWSDSESRATAAARPGPSLDPDHSDPAAAPASLSAAARRWHWHSRGRDRGRRRGVRVGARFESLGAPSRAHCQSTGRVLPRRFNSL